MRIAGTTACVTGAAGGIGRAVARELVERDCRQLILVDVDESGLEATGKELDRKAELLLRIVDVSNRGDVEELARDSARRFGGLNLLVNNAGVTSLSSFVEQPLDDFERILNINLRGVAYGCKAFLPLMRRADGAHIVNMSSIAGLAGMPYQSAYCASKFAVRGLSESLRIELAPLGIGVTCVLPGVVRTNIISSAVASDLGAQQRLSMMLARHLIKPGYVAARIADGVERNTGELRICLEAYLLDYARRVSPRVVRGLMKLIYRLGTQYA